MSPTQKTSPSFVAHEAGREPSHRLSPSYVVGTVLINLPTFSQCGQISQSLQAWVVESINPVLSDEKQTQRSSMTSPGGGAKLEFLSDFLTSNAQMRSVLQLLVRYCFSPASRTEEHSS